MKAIIKEPCHEDWNKMQITMHSRHCLKCEKHLVDFTTFSRAEIIAYLLSNPVGSVCGKMSRQQIDFHIDDYPALIEVLKQPRFQSKAFMILALFGASLFSSCEQASNKRDSVSISKVKHEKNNTEQKEKNVTTKKDNEAPIKTQNTENTVLKVPVIIEKQNEPDFLIGDVIYVENEKIEPVDNSPVDIAEINAQFPGGYTAMMDYFKKNLIYPIDEKNKGIQGKVIVRFVINKIGEVENCEIVKSIPYSKGLETEAIRLIQNMPKWKPAMNNGHLFSQYCTLPIDFKLY